MQKANIQNATYTVLEPNTYLVVATDESRLMEYCAQMNERNHIPGLLDVHRQVMNGETRLYYNVTGKKRLDSLLGNQRLTRAQAEHLLKSLFDLFHLMPEYFLRVGMCVLDLEYLFVDNHFSAYLPLLPLEGGADHSDDELREFFLALLGRHCAGEQPEPYFDRMVKYLIQPNFSLEQMEALASPRSAAPVPPSTPFATPSAAVSAPSPYPFRTPATPPVTPSSAPPAIPSIPEKKKKEKKAAPPPMDFAIPGVSPAAPVISESGTSPAPSKAPGGPADFAIPGAPAQPAGDEKKKKGGFMSIFGGKKEASPTPNTAPKLNMSAETHLLSGSIPQNPAGTPVSARTQPLAPPVIASLDDGEWQGTVSVDSLMEATVMLDTPVHSGPSITYRGRRVELTAFPFTIGKAGCSLNIDNPRVSRCHASIFVENGAYFIRDEGSANHTHLGDGTVLPPYTPYPLSGRVSLLLADEQLEFEAGGRQ